MPDRHAHLLAFCLDHPWSVTPESLQIIAGILARKLAGDQASQAEIEAAIVNRKAAPQPRVGSAAIIPIYGLISPRMNMLSNMSGGTTYESIAQHLRQAVDDKSVRAIVLDVDSPGGSVAGNAELAAEIRRARAQKPVIAQAQYLMASAAYHLGASATEVVAAPSARVGSIGTMMMHTELSKSLERLGIKRTFITAGDGKVDGNEAEPLSTTARERMQAAVDEAYDQFVSNVVIGRGGDVNAQRVKREWKAHVYSAAEARRIGMIDRVATLEETLSRLGV